MTGEPPAAPEPNKLDPGWAAKVVALSRAITASRLPYAFGGAIALNYHREPRSTLDIDINVFVDSEHPHAAVQAVGLAFDVVEPERLEATLKRDGQARTTWGPTMVDLFLANMDFHQAMAQRIQHQPFGNATIPVLSIEDLLVCKTVFNRPKDWIDIDAVAATRRGYLDTGYITNWVEAIVGSDDPRLPRIKQALDTG